MGKRTRGNRKASERDANVYEKKAIAHGNTPLSPRETVKLAQLPQLWSPRKVFGDFG